MMETRAQVIIEIRCAYCGLDHKVQVDVKEFGGEVFVQASARSDGVDVIEVTDLVQ